MKDVGKLGFSIMIVGLLLGLTGIGAIIGFPMMLAGFALWMVASVFQKL
jgi:hypothetical protein